MFFADISGGFFPGVEDHSGFSVAGQRVTLSHIQIAKMRQILCPSLLMRVPQLQHSSLPAPFVSCPQRLLWTLPPKPVA